MYFDIKYVTDRNITSLNIEIVNNQTILRYLKYTEILIYLIFKILYENYNIVE